MPTTTEYTDAERLEKLTQYRQLAFETRKRRPRHAVNVIPVIIGAIGGGMKALKNELKKVFKDQGHVKKTPG